MNKEKILYFKDKLEEEKKLLEKELSTVGEKSKQNPDDWIVTRPNMDTSTADQSELADADEAFGENIAILHNLEVRYTNVKEALKRIEDKKYGLCLLCQKEIEVEKLEANPATATCITHKDELL